MPSLLARLSRKLGHGQAAAELRWLREASNDEKEVQRMVIRRLKDEPLQYILGTQPFGPLNVLTRHPVHIPRPETEQWTSELAHRITSRPALSRPLKLLDLCTGTGCIPMLLSTLLNSHGAEVASLGIDVSTAACQLACENFASMTISPASSLAVHQLDVFNQDFWKAVENAFHAPPLCRVVAQEPVLPLDVITVNPPYIPLSQWQRLNPDVKNWEDPIALIGDPHFISNEDRGLTFYKRIRDLLSCGNILAPAGLLVLEVGDGQASEVDALFRPILDRIDIWKDLWGKERALFLHGLS